MQIADHQVKSASNFDVQRIAFSIGDQVMVQSILRDRLYNNILRVVIQEYASNARDAHRARGNAYRPIEIRLPGKLEPSLVIRDFGLGIPKEKVASVFVQYGISDKRQNNDLTGGFGIGAKCGLAYAKSFIVTTIVKESRPKDDSEFPEMEDQVWKYTWAACIESSGMSAMNLIDEVRAEGQETGTAICVHMKQEHFGTCTTYVKELFRRWEPRPLIVGDLPVTVNQDVVLDDSDEGEIEHSDLYDLGLSKTDMEDPELVKIAEIDRAKRIAEAAAKDPRIVQFAWESEDTTAIDIEGLGGCRQSLAPTLVGNKWVGYVDGLPYSLESQLRGIEMPYSCGYLIFKTGEIEINANREDIRETEENTAMVQKRLAELAKKLQSVAERAFDNKIFFGNPEVKGVIAQLVAYDKYRLLRDLGFTPWEVDGSMSLQTSEYSCSRRQNYATVKVPKKSEDGASMNWFGLASNPGKNRLIALVAPKSGWKGLRNSLTNHIRNCGDLNADRSIEIKILRMESQEGFEYLKRFCGPSVLIVNSVPKAKALRAARTTGCKRVYHVGRQKWALVDAARLEGLALAKLCDSYGGMAEVLVDGVVKQVATSDLDKYFEWISTEKFNYACRPALLKQLQSYMVPSITSSEYRESCVRLKTIAKNKELGDSPFRSFLDKVESTKHEYYATRGLAAAKAIFGFDDATVDPDVSKRVKILKLLTRRFKRSKTLSLIVEKIQEDGNIEDRSEVTTMLHEYLPDITKLDPLVGSHLKELLK